MTDQPMDQPAPSQAAPESEGSAPASVDDLLKEFDASEPAPVDTPPVEPDTPDDPSAPEGDLAAQPEASDRGASDQRLAALEGFANDTILRDAERAETHDFGAVVEEIEKRLADEVNTLPEGYAERWLRSELEVNGNLRSMWNRVYQPGANPSRPVLDALIGELERAYEGMKGEIASRVDPEATADRDAVNAAVRNSQHTAPAEKEITRQDIAAMPEEQKDALRRRLSAQYSGR